VNKGMPWILETSEELRKLIGSEEDEKKRTRLEALLLLQTGQARTRKEIAARLGVNRETVGDWIRAYEWGGRKRMLETDMGGGSQSSLPEEVVEGLKARLKEGTGFGKYEEIVRWVKEKYGCEASYDVIYYTVRKKLENGLVRGKRKKERLEQVSEEVLKGSDLEGNAIL